MTLQELWSEMEQEPMILLHIFDYVERSATSLLTLCQISQLFHSLMHNQHHTKHLWKQCTFNMVLSKLSVSQVNENIRSYVAQQEYFGSNNIGVLHFTGNTQYVKKRPRTFFSSADCDKSLKKVERMFFTGVNIVITDDMMNSNQIIGFKESNSRLETDRKFISTSIVTTKDRTTIFYNNCFKTQKKVNVRKDAMILIDTVDTELNRICIFDSFHQFIQGFKDIIKITSGPLFLSDKYIPKYSKLIVERYPISMKDYTVFSQATDVVLDVGDKYSVVVINGLNEVFSQIQLNFPNVTNLKLVGNIWEYLVGNRKRQVHTIDGDVFSLYPEMTSKQQFESITINGTDVPLEFKQSLENEIRMYAKVKKFEYVDLCWDEIRTRHKTDKDDIGIVVETHQCIKKLLKIPNVNLGLCGTMMLKCMSYTTSYPTIQEFGTVNYSMMRLKELQREANMIFNDQINVALSIKFDRSAIVKHADHVVSLYRDCFNTMESQEIIELRKWISVMNSIDINDKRRVEGTTSHIEQVLNVMKKKLYEYALENEDIVFDKTKWKSEDVVIEYRNEDDYKEVYLDIDSDESEEESLDEDDLDDLNDSDLDDIDLDLQSE
jgi:hypothetical protein